jgi:hypothetical protein
VIFLLHSLILPLNQKMLAGGHGCPLVLY